MRNARSIDELRGIYARLARSYDVRHALLTARADRRGRSIVVDRTVARGDYVLDCGAGTGATGIAAACKVGPRGKVTLFDLSDDMLDVGRKKVVAAGLQSRVTLQSGDAAHLPFADGQFDSVLSTYSLCPVADPQQVALELYRVTRPGGKLGVAHSVEPTQPFVKWLAARVETWAWHFPSLSMGCRPVDVLPTLLDAGAKLLFTKRLGVPLWPFLVFVVEKPAF